MNEAHRHQHNGAQSETTSAPTRAASPPPAQRRKRSLSMHDGIAVWCDCCSCEAEPYWVEAGEAMGIDLGSDYEDADG